MTPHKWQKEIIHWANGGLIEGHLRTWVSNHWQFVAEPKWNDPDWTFRIYDPYAELKAAAADPEKEIRAFIPDEGWTEWISEDNWKWCRPPDQYEIRDKPKDDPYRPLKEAAANPEKEIRLNPAFGHPGIWRGNTWGRTWNLPPDHYEIRDKPKPKKVVKSECWRYRIDGTIMHKKPGFWKNPEDWVSAGWQRFPAGDIEGEIEE